MLTLIGLKWFKMIQIDVFLSFFLSMSLRRRGGDARPFGVHCFCCAQEQLAQERREAAADNVRRVLKKLRAATPETFKELQAELDRASIANQQVGRCFPLIRKSSKHM